MRYIGIIPADRLPSSSIGLRSMEFNRLKFARTIAYTSARATVVRQYQGVEVAKSIEELRRLVEKEPDEAVVYVNGYFKLDSETMQVFGTPGENEVRCIAGKLFAGSTPLGDKSLLKVMEYDRRRNVSRYMKGDSGDIRVDVADMRGPVVMDARCLRKLLESGNDWTRTIEEFQDTVDASGASIVCMDPMKHGVRWHPGLIPSEKKPTSVIVRGTVTAKHIEEPETKKDDRVAHGVVVSMSTYRKRFPVLDESLGSILSQTIKPEKICVVIDDVDVPYITDYLKGLHENGVVEIIVGKRELGPHNKYVHAMVKYPSYAVATFDDDARYKPNALEELYETYKRHPRCVVARRAHLIKYDADGNPLPYRQWVNQCTSVLHPSFDLFATGVGGVLYPPGLFSWTLDDLERMKEFRNDDLFMKKVENDLGIKVVATGTPKDADPRIKRDGAQDNALLNFNVNGGNNDVETIRLGIRRVEPAVVEGKPFFRIVTPVYKSSRTLKRAIGSIASQTFDDYVSVVCDDGSPQEYMDENRKTVEALGEKGIFLSNETNMYAGAARNRCLAAATESAYTLFLDADDKFSYDGLFSDLHDFIVENDFPDLVLLPSFKRDGTSTKGIVYNRIRTVEQFAADRRFEVPWCKCIRSNLVQPFQEGLRRCNDVLQHFLTVDTISTIAAFHREAVTYCADSETTMFGTYGSSNRRQKPAFTSYLDCAKALVEHRWVHPYAATGAANEAEFIVRHSMPQFISGLGPSGLSKMVMGV